MCSLTYDHSPAGTEAGDGKLKTLESYHQLWRDRRALPQNRGCAAVLPVETSQQPIENIDPTSRHGDDPARGAGAAAASRRIHAACRWNRFFLARLADAHEALIIRSYTQ